MLSKLEEHLQLPSPITRITQEIYSHQHIDVFIKRDDLIHPLICGNKWRKLKYNLISTIDSNHNGVISFGGMYSNHLVALAAAGHYLGLPTCGLIRSYRVDSDNPSIQTMLDYGMQLEYIWPTNYKSKESDSAVHSVVERYQGYHLIPEGGTNLLALKGVVESVDEIDNFNFTHVVVGLGTGGTIAGVLQATRKYQTIVIGVSPFQGEVTDLAGFTLLSKDDQRRMVLMPSTPKTRFGGFDKRILQYLDRFYDTHGIMLDPIYTAKVFMTVENLVVQHYFPKGSRILIMHTGGLQGLQGYKHRYRKKMSSL